MSENPLLCERREDGVVILTLNRPEAMNAMSPAMFEQLASILRELRETRDAGCIVVTGSGRGFCAGGDVGAIAARDGGPAADAPGAEFDAFEAHLNRQLGLHRDVAFAFYECPIPTIALVNGAAAGGGLALAAGADLRIASRTAVFTTAFGKVGRSGDFGGTFLLRQLVGPAIARELYFTSRRVEADEALRIGLVNEVVEAEALMARGLALAAEIAAGPRRAHARMKRVFLAADAHDAYRAAELEATFMTLSGRTSEGRAFLEAYMNRKK